MIRGSSAARTIGICIRALNRASTWPSGSDRGIPAFTSGLTTMSILSPVPTIFGDPSPGRSAAHIWKDGRMKLRLGIALWLLSWVPYGILLGLTGAWFTIAWVVEILLGVTGLAPVSYTHLRAHETVLDLVCRLLLEKK